MISTAFEPKVVLISRATGVNSTQAIKLVDMAGKETVVFSNTQNVDIQYLVAITPNGFTVDGPGAWVNENGVIYKWIAIG